MNQSYLVDENSNDVGNRTDSSPFDRAYRGLLRGLYEGSFIPGQRLAAPDLMDRFGVGRGTIREVLHRLVASGVVSIIPNRGAAVRHLTRKEVNSVLDVVEVLLGLAARDAAVHLRSEKERERFRELHRRLHPTGGNSDAFDFFGLPLEIDGVAAVAHRTFEQRHAVAWARGNSSGAASVPVS